MTHVDVNGSPLPSTSSMSMQYSHGIYLSAPGKIILFGEHAVVYGKTAIAGSIDLRTFVSLFTSQDGVIYLSLPDLNVEKTWMLKDLHKAAEKLAEQGTFVDDPTMPPSLEVIVPLARKLSGSCEETCGVQHLAVLAFWYILLGVAQRKRDMSAVKLTVKFKLPSCVGLGSSGAYCVCITAGLLQATGLIPPPHVEASTGEENVCTWDDVHLDMIRKWAASAESLIHGRASGIDAAVCTYGGVASFKPGAKIQHLKTCTKPDLKVILVNSKVERNTSRMVATVKDRYRKYPDVVENIFNAIDGISKEAVTLLTRNESLSAPALVDQHRPSITLNNATLTVGTNQSGSSSSDHGSIMAGDFNDDEHRSLQGGTLTPRGSTSGPSTPRSNVHDGFAMLNDLCRINNQLLIALGVGHPKIDQICTLLARYGIHPKMTGAGGGGSVFAFLKPDTSPTVMGMIESELGKLGYELWRPPLGGVGVVQHYRRPEIFGGGGNATPTARSRAPSAREAK